MRIPKRTCQRPRLPRAAVTAARQTHVDRQRRCESSYIAKPIDSNHDELEQDNADCLFSPNFPFDPHEELTDVRFGYLPRDAHISHRRRSLCLQTQIFKIESHLT